MVTYTFGEYAPDIYANESGNFFELLTQKPLKKRYYNGRICIDFNKKRFGLKTLRGSEMSILTTYPF